MVGASKTSSYFAEAMASDGFVVECGRSIQGELEREWFVIISREPSMFAGLHKIPTASWVRKTSSPVSAHDWWVSGPLTEAEVRSKMDDAGLATSVIDTKLEWAWHWATTITRQAGSESALWWPRGQ
jgi:hypothetical protein